MSSYLNQIDVLLPLAWPRAPSDRRETAENHIGSIFTAHRIEDVERAPIRLQHERADLGALSFNRLCYGAPLVIVAPPLPDFYLFQVTLQGELVIEMGEAAVRLDTGSVFVMNPGVPYRKRWGADSRQLLVRIPSRVLERRLAGDLGRAALSPVRFRPSALEPGVRTEALLRLLGALCQDLADPAGLATRPAAAEALEGAFLSALLAAMPHDQSEALARPPSAAAPYYVNRAEQYMRAHATEAISMERLAAAAGVTERTLQQGFRRFRGASPMRTLQNIRLDLARDELMRGLSGDRLVTHIALDSGFGHLGRFARSYAERFGESPSETLKRRRYQML